MKNSRIKIMLLGSGELGKEFAISAHLNEVVEFSKLQCFWISGNSSFALTSPS